jgi:hypothetical protein
MATGKAMPVPDSCPDWNGVFQDFRVRDCRFCNVVVIGTLQNLQFKAAYGLEV